MEGSDRRIDIQKLVEVVFFQNASFICILLAFVVPAGVYGKAS